MNSEWYIVKLFIATYAHVLNGGFLCFLIQRLAAQFTPQSSAA